MSVEINHDRLASKASRQKLEPNATSKKAVGIGRYLRIVGNPVARTFERIAEVRAQKALIEGELYLNRYRHTSKNDDDLPVLWLETSRSTADATDRPYSRSALKRSSMRHRAIVVVYTFGMLAVVFVAILALRAAVLFHTFRY